MQNELKQVLNMLIYLRNKAEARAAHLPEGEGKEAMVNMHADLADLTEKTKVMLLNYVQTKGTEER